MKMIWKMVHIMKRGRQYKMNVLFNRGVYERFDKRNDMGISSS